MFVSGRHWFHLMVSKRFYTDMITNDFPESISSWCTFYTHKSFCCHFEHNFYLCSSFWIYLSKQVLFISPISYAQNCEIVLTQVKSSKIFIKASRALKPSLYKFKFSNALLRRLWWKPKIESFSFLLDQIIPYIEQTKTTCSKAFDCFPLLVVYLNSANTARAPKLRCNLLNDFWKRKVLFWVRSKIHSI